MKVRVYYNLNKSVWSIKAMEGTLKGRVVAHAKGVALYDARTIVSQAGRERVLREGRKNVHAYIEGSLQAVQDVQMRYEYDMGVHHVSDVEQVVSYGRCWEAVRYNPYQVAHFYWDHDGESTEFQDLDHVVMTDTREVWVTGEHHY